MFLPEGAAVIEIFPYKYYKETYFTLSKHFNLTHMYIQSQTVSHQLLTYVSLENCMSDLSCRSFARIQNIELTFDEINAIISGLLAKEIQLIV